MNDELNVYEEEFDEVEDYETDVNDFEEGEISNGSKAKLIAGGALLGAGLTGLGVWGVKKLKKLKKAKDENEPKTKKKLMLVEVDEDGNYILPDKQYS